MAGEEREPLLGRMGGGPHFKPTKHDPIVKLGSRRVENALVQSGLVDEGKKHEVVMRATALTVFPILIFNVVLMIYWRFYHTRPLVTMAFALQIMLMAVLLPQFSRKRSDTWDQKWKDYLSGFCFAAAVAGVALILVVYYRHLVYYEKYHEMRMYTNIAASSPPMNVADGGIVEFSLDSELDRGQTIGYRSADLGVTMCVAPVVDSSMDRTDAISFFAVGMNCCGWRGQFRCGDALDMKAKSGLLLVPPQQLVEAQMEWAVKDDELIRGYHSAVKLHAAVYGSRATDDVRFLTWTSNPRAARDDFWRDALVIVLSCDAVFICVCALVASVTALGPRRVESVGEAALANFVKRAGNQLANSRGIP